MPTETNIANLALTKLGGAGDGESGNALISSIDGDDKLSAHCKLNFPRARRRTIVDLATLECPFRSTVRFKDLGAELSSGSIPEIGEYQHAFNLPGTCLEVVRQFDESVMLERRRPNQARSPVAFQWETVASKSGNGKILLTNTLSNLAGTSAFIEYVIDTPQTGSFTEQMIECIATLLATLIAPIAGRDMEAGAFLLQQYLDVAIPNAQAANQRGFNDTARTIPDYSGGRSTGGVGIRASGDLGTFVNAAGNRQSIF